MTEIRNKPGNHRNVQPVPPDAKTGMPRVSPTPGKGPPDPLPLRRPLRVAASEAPAARAQTPESARRDMASQAERARTEAQRERQLQRNMRRRATLEAIETQEMNMRFTGEKPSALLYLGVSMIALLKDLLDLVGIGSLPAIGTVVTICFTFLIWMLLALFDRSSQHTRLNMHLARGLVVMGFGLVEAVGFGLNFLPLQTAMVIVLYILAKRAWRHAVTA